MDGAKCDSLAGAGELPCPSAPVMDAWVMDPWAGRGEAGPPQTEAANQGIKVIETHA